ncbi:alpha-1,2-fucosyltransferase [Vibrio cyclitrophicus]
MILIRLVGGLGNQLFQLSYALYLRGNQSLPIYLDTSAMGNYETPRELTINKIVDLDVLNVHLYQGRSLINKFRMVRLFSLSMFGVFFINDSSVREQPVRLRKAFLDGYFIKSVSQDIFISGVERIREALKPNLMTFPPNCRSDVCVLHIRGGDFLNDKKYNICDETYYSLMVEKVKKCKGISNFIILSEDVEYASKLAKGMGINAEVCSGTLEEDFEMLFHSKHVIGSNSTFCFWARALSSDPSKSTYLPAWWDRDSERSIYF